MSLLVTLACTRCGAGWEEDYPVTDAICKLCGRGDKVEWRDLHLVIPLESDPRRAEAHCHQCGSATALRLDGDRFVCEGAHLFPVRS